MKIPKGRLRGTFDAANHILLASAAEKAGYTPHYFANRIAPAYRIQSFTDGHRLFFDKAMFNSALTKLHKRVQPNGAHAPGKLPRAIKKKVRSDFGKAKGRRRRRKTTSSQHVPVVINTNGNRNNGVPEVEVVVTRAMFESLVRSGQIKPKFVVTD